MERKYFQDIGYKPFLFYMVFGVSAEELEISRERHKVDELPEGLDIRSLSRKQHGNYIDGFLTGAMGEVLMEQAPELFQRCREAENCSILQGTVVNDSTLDYMRNAIGIIQAFIDKGAVGILDPQAITLYSPERWTPVCSTNCARKGSPYCLSRTTPNGLPNMPTAAVFSSTGR